jgi:hypothetical protein
VLISLVQQEVIRHSLLLRQLAVAVVLEMAEQAVTVVQAVVVTVLQLLLRVPVILQQLHLARATTVE